MALSSDRLALFRAALAGKGLAAPRAQAIPRRSQRTRAPLSFAQERLFFLELYQPGTALYNDCVAVHIEGALDPDRLARALGRVQARHEILRTTFVLAKDGPEQRIHEAGAGDVPAPLRTLELTGTHDTHEAARVFAREEAAQPFDLGQAPPWRVALARLGATEWQLVLTMHHIVSDGATMGLFFDELARAYDRDESATRAHEPAAATSELQFGDYAAWERAQLDEPRAAQHLAYWKRVLAGDLPALVWPAARGRASQRGATVPLGFGAESVARIAALARAHEATPNHVLLAAWLALLSATSGTPDQRTGLASSLRTRRELEPLLGFFVQSLVLRADLGDDPDFGALVRRVRAVALEAHAHAELPFDRVVRALEHAPGHERGASLAPTFFSHMRDAIRAPAFTGLRTRWEFVDTGLARFELALILHESEQAVTGFLEYDLGLFAPETAERLAGDYAGLVQRALARPEARLSELCAPCLPRASGRRKPLPIPVRQRRASGA